MSTKAIVDGATLSVQFAGDNSIEFGGKTFAPDRSVGYFSFSISHAFPVVTKHGTALHPRVIAKSYQSLNGKMLNLEHLVALYHAQPGVANHIDDRIIGYIASASYPTNAPVAVQASAENTPGIEGVAAFFKAAKGVNEVVGAHLSQRHDYSVSMEVEFMDDESGFAVPISGGRGTIKSEFTPTDMRAAGFEYWPFTSAPAELRATWSQKKAKIAAQYKGRQPALLMGGLDGTVDYIGVGLVKRGAEPTAEITRMAASANQPVTDFVAFKSLADFVCAALAARSNS